MIWVASAILLVIVALYMGSSAGVKSPLDFIFFLLIAPFALLFVVFELLGNLFKLVFSKVK